MDTTQTIPDLLRSNGSAQSVTVKLTESTKHLFAAAPELLEVRKTVLNIAKASSPGQENLLDDDIALLEAAITKATGGSDVAGQAEGGAE